MPKILRSVWEDISRGKNIIAYLLIMAAVLVPALSIARLASIEWMLRLVLPTLGLLVATTLLNRRILERLEENPPGIDVGVLKSWGSGEVYRALAGARKSVVIVTSWVIDSAVLAGHICNAAATAKGEISVDVYMLDPDGSLGAQRYSEIFPRTAPEDLPKKFRNRFEEAIANFSAGFTSLANVRACYYAYSSMPEIKLFVVDGKHYFFSWLMAGGPSTDNICLHVSAENLSEGAQLLVSKLETQLKVIKTRSRLVNDQ